MSINPNSDYNRIRNDRTKINNLVNYGRESSRDFPRCPTCLEQWRLEIVNSEDGTKKMGKCVRGCGHLFDLDKTINEETGSIAPKYRTKYTSVTKSFILRKDHKKKSKQTGSINDQLSDSDRDDIRKSIGVEPN